MSFERNSIRKFFVEAFSARDITEPLASFDADTSSDVLRKTMDAEGFDIAGVRRDGRLAGFVEKCTLGNGPCGPFRKHLDSAPSLPDNAPLLAVLIALKRAPFVLVSAFGEVAGIIRTVDLHKPPVRMWLFGLVTLIEMRFTDLIRNHASPEHWEEQLSASRRQKAQELLAYRRPHNPAVQLLDCLQFADKGQLVVRNEELRRLTVFTSRRQGQEAVRRLEQLRNSLAHAQDILVGDWDTIIDLCEFISVEPSPDAVGSEQREARPQ